MIIARQLETLVETSRNLPEKEESNLIVEILEKFDYGGQQYVYRSLQSLAGLGDQWIGLKKTIEFDRIVEY